MKVLKLRPIRNSLLGPFSLLLFPAAARASSDLEQTIAHLSVQSVLWASALIFILIGFTALRKARSNLVFGLIVGLILATTGLLIGSTIYINNLSSSKGPVHWHADTEVWACGKRVEYKDPTGLLSNKIGTSTLHEHNDGRIHLEGVVVRPLDATLGKFFKVIGGQITKNTLIVPTNSGDLAYVNGQPCGSETGQVQVFVYRTTPDKFYTLEKLSDPANYMISPESNVPPADCIIVEFEATKNTTDRMCRSYQVALQVGRLKGKQ